MLRNRSWPRWPPIDRPWTKNRSHDVWFSLFLLVLETVRLCDWLTAAAGASLPLSRRFYFQLGNVWNTCGMASSRLIRRRNLVFIQIQGARRDLQVTRVQRGDFYGYHDGALFTRVDVRESLPLQCESESLILDGTNYSFYHSLDLPEYYTWLPNVSMTNPDFNNGIEHLKTTTVNNIYSPILINKMSFKKWKEQWGD